MLPHFLIIGAQKSGSTFILNCLREHPAVFMPAGEVRFFEDPEYLHSDIRQLEDLFRDVPPRQAVGIKRPAYLARPECAARIHRHIPDARLIVVLRNPMERAISAYFHLMETGFIPIKAMEAGMRKVIDGEYDAAHPRARDIIDFGLYHHHITRYLEFFDRQQILVMLFDNLEADPLASMRKIYRFLGVDDDYVPVSLTMRSSQNPGVYSLTRLRFLSILNPVMFSYATDKRKRYRKPVTPFSRSVKRAITGIDKLLLVPICNNSKPRLSADLRDRLFQVYREDIAQLEGFLGQQLTVWKPAARRSTGR